MQKDYVNFLCCMIGATCLCLSLAIARLCIQRDTIARQQQQIENYKIMLLSIPVDGRDEQGRRVKP